MRALIVLLALATAARAEPSNERLVLVGLAMAPPMYAIGVTLHEGSHAVAGTLVGADITEIHLFPPGIDPMVHKFRFGWVYAQGLKTRGDRIFFYIAPKITDAVLLGGFAALVVTSAWPDNKYGQLALTVAGTGLWVDFAKDVVLFSPHNDVVKVFHLWCMRGWKQIAPRLLYAGISAGFGYVVFRAYQKTFTDNPPMSAPLMLPLVTTRF